MSERRADENEDIETPSGAEERNPTGGDTTTEEQLVADNPVEEDTLKALDPDAPSA